MASEGSISRCITLLRQGEGAAAQVIWEPYFPQLVRLASSQRAGVSTWMKDEEDIALSALDRFCRAVNQGRCPQLADRHGLWRSPDNCPLLSVPRVNVATPLAFSPDDRLLAQRIDGSRISLLEVLTAPECRRLIVEPFLN
jgi:hypothetical protein